MSFFQSVLHQLRVDWLMRPGAPYPGKLPELPVGALSERRRKQVDDLQCVCLFLGPYRNLTTLTAGVLFLHPECQVLNHAGPRLLPEAKLNFLQGYTEEKFRNFCHYALTMSQGGERGRYGGSVLLAHAYADHPDMQRRYKRRFGNLVLKKKIKSLVWKESERVTRFVREHNVDLASLVQQNRRIKFLLPIRNPLDCALSISRIGISRFYPELNDGDIHKLIHLILTDIKEFLALQELLPENFFSFYQDDMNRQVLIRLSDFLRLKHDQAWLDDAIDAYTIKRKYEYPADLLSFYREAVGEKFASMPAVIGNLIREPLDQRREHQ